MLLLRFMRILQFDGFYVLRIVIMFLIQEKVEIKRRELATPNPRDGVVLRVKDYKNKYPIFFQHPLQSNKHIIIYNLEN